MNETRTLNHSKYECKYHLVFIPKYRKKTLYVELRQYLGEIFKELAKQRESEVLEGHLMPDHVHMMISIPPKYAVSQVVGISKEKVRYIWRECIWARSEILWVRVFGLVGIMFQR